MGNLKELARADRFELQILGKLKLEGSSAPAESCLCNTVNISTSGALVETGFIVPKGSLVKYTFTLPGTDRSVEITGEIIRVEPGTDAPRRIRPSGENTRKILRYGIMFLDLNDSDRGAMDEFLTFYKKRNEHQRT